MLHPDTYAPLTADDWAEIAQDLLKPKKDEQLIVAMSDAHEGGVTSKHSDVDQLVKGFSKHAHTVLLNGDDFEFESPSKLTEEIRALIAQYASLPKAESDAKIQKAAETILLEKVAKDSATLEALITENPTRQIVKVIGNHENFKPFRDALDALQKKHPNFQWSSEIEMIPIPGAKAKKPDHLLAVHGDLQMDDLWFVEEGGSDKERKLYSLEDMAKKAVKISTKLLQPSAQLQEKSQGFVNWWRRPKVTAKILYTELNNRARFGTNHQMLEQNTKATDATYDAMEAAEDMFKKRRKKFVKMIAELDSEGEPTENKQRNKEAMQRAVEMIDTRLEDIKAERERYEDKNMMFHEGIKALTDQRLHYKQPGSNTPHLFTEETLKSVTHINYGHTHVPCIAHKISGTHGTITISNNASMTGAIMQKPLDNDGKPAKKPTQERYTDPRNLGILIYRTEKGKVTQITSVGELLAENMQRVSQLIRRKLDEKHARATNDNLQQGTIDPERFKRDDHDRGKGNFRTGS